MYHGDFLSPCVNTFDTRSKQSFKSKVTSDFNMANPVARYNRLNSLEKSLEERYASIK